MRLNIIKVGNSRELQIPKAIIDKYQIKKSVELSLKEGYIELRPSKRVRENWRSKLSELKDDPNEEDRILDFFEDEEL